MKTVHRWARTRRVLAGLIVAMAGGAGCQQAAGTAAVLPQTTPVADGQFLSARKGRGADWRDEVIYFVLTDRFQNGDRSNDINVKPRDPHAYHGGDFQGIIDKLSYIKNLGATAIWITPINDNKDDSLVNKYWGFHGYWAKDFEAVDEHLGNEAKFKELVRKAHELGLKVMLDMVVNHAGYDAPMAKDPKFSDWFHHNGNITNWEDQGQLENNDIHGLPDFNTENPKVITYMEDMWTNWIKRTGIDGFRMDTVKHVPLKFWTRFNSTLHQRAPGDFLLLGEVLQGDPRYLAPYTREGRFDSLFDFPMYFTLADVFARGQSMRKLGDRLSQDGAYQDATLLAPFLDNHDVPRFLTTAGGDERRLRLAMAFLFTMRGIPTMYYGTETGMKGGGEPENREDMDFGANPKLTDYTRKLLALRRDLTPLRRGRMLEMWQDDDVYGFTRLVGAKGAGQDEVLVFLNNGDKTETRQVSLRSESGLPDGTAMAERLAGQDVVTVTSRRLTITLGPKECKIYAKQSLAVPKRR